MSDYAKNTEVSAERSIAEIRNTLKRFGASGFVFGEHDEPPRAFLEFEMQRRRVRFLLPMPQRDDFKLNSYGNRRPETAIQKDFDQAIRQRWRSLALVVKAKLVAVDDKIVSFEQEFAMHFVMNSGATIYETLKPSLNEICEQSKLPPMLSGK